MNESQSHDSETQTRWFSPSELAALPGMPNRRENVTRKAKTEGWRSRKRNAKGGGQEYAFSSLPDETQAALTSTMAIVNHSPPSAIGEVCRASNETEASIEPSIVLFLKHADAYLAKFHSSKHSPAGSTGSVNRKEQRIEAWLQILYVYELWCELTQFETAIASEIEFCRIYNSRQIRFADAAYIAISSMSRATLHRKRNLRQSAKQLTALAGNYGNRKGAGRIDQDSELQNAIEVCIAAGCGQWKPSHIYEILQEEFGYDSEDLSLVQLRAWIRRFRAEHPQKYAMYKDANRAKGTIVPAFGSRSQGIDRPNQVWQVDSFRTDVLLRCRNDLAGSMTVKRYSLVGCIDVFTRRAIVFVSEYSKAEAVCQVLSMAILRWGVPEVVQSVAFGTREACSRQRISQSPRQTFLAELRNQAQSVSAETSRAESVYRAVWSHLSASGYSEVAIVCWASSE